MIKVIIIDDHPLIIEGLQMLFVNSSKIQILNSFLTAKHFMDDENNKKADLILLDVFLPDMNGIDFCIKIKKMNPSIKILAMSSQAERSIILQMIKNGANGYLLKSANIEEYEFCIEHAMMNEIVFSKEVNTIISSITSKDLQKTPRLTKREKEIVSLLQKGKSTQEISEILFLSFLTVQTHRRNLLNKFHVKNVVELINYINQNNLL